MLRSDKILSLTYHDDLTRIIFWMYRVDLQHILKCIEIHYSPLSSILICSTILFLLVVSSLVVLRLHARFSVSPVCVGAPDKHVVSRSFLSRFTVVEVSKCTSKSIERASQLEGIPCYEWSSVLLLSAHIWCCGPGRNLAILRCGPG